MNCCFCHFNNLEGDHRCLRCGRRVASPNGAAPMFMHGSAAPALDFFPEETPEAVPAPEIKRGARVIPIDILDQRFRQNAAAANAQAYPLPDENLRPGIPDAEHDEQSLPAHWAHRLIAFSLDASMIVSALGIFAGILLLAGIPVVLSLTTAPVYLGVAALLGFFYEALWAIAGSETPGCRWAQLELLDLDGHRASTRQRWNRIFGRVISVGSAGLGILWSLVDDHGLSWHDYMSNSYLTPKRQKR